MLDRDRWVDTLGMRIRGAGIVGVVIAAVGVATPGAAQEHVGVRVGVSGDPDQFVFGGHVETEPLLDRLVFRPTGEIGVGDDVVLVGLNFEFAYKIPLDDNPWTVYLGAGPALNIFSFDDSRRRRDDTEVEGGFAILLGAEHEGGLFTEFKVGFSDSPDLKFLVGYSF